MNITFHMIIYIQVFHTREIKFVLALAPKAFLMLERKKN